MTKENDLKSVCLCGHRGDKLPRGIRLETLKHNITQEIQKAIDLGYTNFICMCGQGFDLISAQLLLDLKEQSFPHITLSAVIPHEEQARDWSEKDRNTYYDILEKCDLEILVCTKYMLSCYDVALTYIIDNSSHLICFCDDLDLSFGGKLLVKATENNISISNLYKQ